MKDKRLKPCPMCGNESPDIHNVSVFDDDECWCVKCPECGLELNDYHQEDDAIEAWNKRYYEDKEDEETQCENKKKETYESNYGCIYRVAGIGKTVKIPDITIGDTLYFVNDGKCCEGKVRSINFNYSCSTDFVVNTQEFKSIIIISFLAGTLQYTFDDIGKKIFFTREDAENYIKEQEEKNLEFDMVKSILTLNRNSFAYELFREHEMYKKGVIMSSPLKNNEALWEYKNKDMETDKFARHRFVCSNCDSPTSRDESGCCFELTPYCPYCGKKMVGLDLRLIED